MINFGEFESDDPRSLEFALDAFPAQMDGMQLVPIPPKSKPAWAKHLHELGFRHHPELMEKFPIPGDQPGMGYLNPNRYVDKAEYERTQAVPENLPDSASNHDKALVLLRAINAPLADTLSKLPPEEAAKVLADQEKQIPALLESVAKIRELMERENNDGS